MLLVVAPVLLVMALVSFGICYQLIKAEAYSRFVGFKNVSAERVSKIIRGAELNANNIFDEVSRSLNSSEDVVGALKKKANLNLDVRGYFAAFEPDFFPEKGTWFEPYIFQLEHGGFDYRQVGSASHDYTKSLWYVQAKSSGQSFWSNPYNYDDGTSMSGHYCTFVKPIYDEKGDLACVCGADMKFEWLAKELQRVDGLSKTNKILNKYHILTNNDYNSVILGSDGTCLTQPEEGSITITDKAMLKDLKNRKAGEAEIAVNGVTCTVYYGPIEFIDWSVAVIIPKQDVFNPMLPIALVLLAMVVAGMIIVWFVSRPSRSQNSE